MAFIKSHRHFRPFKYSHRYTQYSRNCSSSNNKTAAMQINVITCGELASRQCTVESCVVLAGSIVTTSLFIIQAGVNRIVSRLQRTRYAIPPFVVVFNRGVLCTDVSVSAQNVSWKQPSPIDQLTCPKSGTAVALRTD